MGISGETEIIIRNYYSRKIEFKSINDLYNIDCENFEIWTNIGWSKINKIEEEINFSPMCIINSDLGILSITHDNLNKVTKLALPKQIVNDKWKLSNQEAFLLGYFLKYGILDNRFNFILNDPTIDCKNIKKFLEIFDKVEGVRSSIHTFDNNRYVIKNIYDKLIWNKYFSFLYNLEFEKIIPNIILNSDFLTQTYFLLGYLGELNYDKIEPYLHLIKCLRNKYIKISSKKLLTGLYFLCKNIGLNIITGNFIQNKTWFYYIKYTNENETESETNFIPQILSSTVKSYIITPEKENVDLISVGIGELAVKIY